MSFVDASQYCINKMSGANLASIMDWNENDKIGGLVYNRSIALSRQFAWIGLTNEALLSGMKNEYHSFVTDVRDIRNARCMVCIKGS